MGRFSRLPSQGSVGSRFKPFWYETALRIKDPTVSVPFYTQHFNMKLLDKKSTGEETHFTLVSSRENDAHNSEAVDENAVTGDCVNKLHCVLRARTALVVRHRKGSETSSSFKINNGNEEPYRGFGHIAFNCNDVYKSSAQLEANGVAFRKRPDEGRMKGLAFALDPDGYWIELCGRSRHPRAEEFNLSQTMIRVKDPEKSIAFYRDVLGMVVVREMHMSDFSNYFLACLDQPPPLSSSSTLEEERDLVHSLWNPCLELTHNHGTEKQPDFHYHNGNAPPPVGFSHLAFHVSDLQQFRLSANLESSTAAEPAEETQQEKESSTVTVVYLQDPDGYHIKLIDASLIAEI